jgi:hypothetical protein
LSALKNLVNRVTSTIGPAMGIKIAEVLAKGNKDRLDRRCNEPAKDV